MLDGGRGWQAGNKSGEQRAKTAVQVPADCMMKRGSKPSSQGLPGGKPCFRSRLFGLGQSAF